MATCWTCGSETDEFIFSCPQCKSYDSNSSKYNDEMKLIELALIKKEGFSSIGSKLSSIATKLEWGYNNIFWEYSLQSDLLQGIERSLKTPSQIEANELRKMAEESRKAGKLKESEELFLKAIKTYQLDFRSYVGLAFTYLMTNNPEKARKYLLNSIFLAPNCQDFDYRSYSHRILAHIAFCQNDYNTSGQHIAKCLKPNLNYDFGYYDFAVGLIRSGDTHNCERALRKAICLNPELFLLANNDRRFSKMNDFLKNFFYEKKDLMLKRFREIQKLNKEILVPLEIINNSLALSQIPFFINLIDSYLTSNNYVELCMGEDLIEKTERMLNERISSFQKTT